MPDTSKHLYLLIPGFFGPQPGPDESEATAHAWPALETLLARASAAHRTLPHGLEATLFALFHADSSVEGDLPVAAVTRALDTGVIDNGWWVRADPVHLRPERDRLILADSHVLDLTQDEASRLAAEIAKVYVEDGLILKAPRPGRWYLKPARAPRISTTPLPEVVARDIHPYLPQGKDGKAWHTILNEVQILLHTAKVNEERERRGKLPINSLWFWGGGRLPKIKPVSWTQIWSEEPVSLALARLTETSGRALPAGFEDWRRQADRAGEHLVVLDSLRAPFLYGDQEAWSAAMTRLERDWMAPLSIALRAETLSSATLLTDAGRGFHLSPKAMRRWWRRRHPLASYA
ncbi:MAG: hypothetical protein A2151_05430 [Candidatus Muproteobacteria bacterium RBG_16_65_34]|uniref:Phosphoglycerate mutase n=1 Tax=Candidatus Muproteobacteria bacterium RBG_16_65_34 TaxID=1817760 RepID=A0A1F6TQ78_9PROT|nr:MAG: hypothetical protein A2151_05430 [Candidatus Muproteobacteria bacterium RBG_16_65_34]